MSIKRLIAKIRSSNNFLITSHVNLEGDALGSELAFYMLVKKLGKNAVVVNEDDTPEAYEFLPRVKEIKKYKQNFKGPKFDCLSVLDCSNLKRCGEVYRLYSAPGAVINIDHHVSNDMFGDFNWVDPSYSCASEIVYELYKKMRVPLDKEAALCLYTGILADTGAFRYTNTTSRVHKTISELMSFGIDAHFVYNRVYGNIPLQDIKLFTKILPGLKNDPTGKIAWFEVRKRDIRHKKLYIDLTDQLLTFARLIRGIEVVVLFKENLGLGPEVRVNFRSQGKVDVNKIAVYFGGGGHKAASGATIKGKIEKIRPRVINKIKEAIS